jgi:hypothetical protein
MGMFFFSMGLACTSGLFDGLPIEVLVANAATAKFGFLFDVMP